MSALDDLVKDMNNQADWYVTGPDEGQCTAVPHEWEERLGLPIVYGNAIDTFDNAPDDLYEKELNTPTGVPKPGAILVYGEYPAYNISGQYGHTGVALAGCTVGTLITLEQNWGEQVVRVHSRDYGGVKGWFWPRILGTEPTPAPAPKPVPNPPQTDPLPPPVDLPPEEPVEPSKPKPKEIEVKKPVSKIDYQDIAFRALKTFVQSFAAVVLATNQPLSKQTLVAALAAGISAVWNIVKAVVV